MTLDVKKDFPILQRKVQGKPLVYLNSAATSQKPRAVIDAMHRFYEEGNANIHRGNDFMSVEATRRYDGAREKIAGFIGAETEEIIFTSGTTAGINLLMYSLGDDLKSGDEILLTMMEHHSNLVPWQQLKKKGVHVLYADIDEEGRLKMNEFEQFFEGNVKLVCVTAVSNVLGTVNPIKEICEIAHAHGAFVVVDAAQVVPHLPVDVKNWNCDFLVFSGHKMLGPMGVGVLYGKKEILENMKLFLFGGDMIKEVSLEETSFAELPRRFEAGTQNVEAVIGLAEAVDYLEKIGMKNIEEHEKELTRYALERMQQIDGLQIYGPPGVDERLGVISFNLGNFHAHDVAEFLGSRGIAVRAGHMCCQPLMKRLGISSCVRASFYFYNTLEDVDALCSVLEECRRFFER